MAAKQGHKRLKLVAGSADVEKFRPRRLRDTWAAEQQLGGPSIDDNRTLLGHGSVRTSERFYAPCNLARRGRLTESSAAGPRAARTHTEKALGSVSVLPAEASLANPNVPELAQRDQGSI